MMYNNHQTVYEVVTKSFWPSVKTLNVKMVIRPNIKQNKIKPRPN